MNNQLRQAAQAVVDRWDSPLWDWRKEGPTADLIATLRAALEQQAELSLSSEEIRQVVAAACVPEGMRTPEMDDCLQKYRDRVTGKVKIQEREDGYKARWSDAQRKQQAEPVFENLDYVAVVYSPSNAMLKSPLPIGTHLYKYPPQRKPLTDEEIEAIHQSTWMQSTATLNDFARAIEAAHGIKENT